jgi:transposase
VEYVGIDWASRRAAWCALDGAGGLLGEGVIPADRDGLTRLVARRGLEVSAAVEMMSGAVWVADTLRAAGWRVQVADARKAKALAPLAAKTDRIDARVLAELCRRELVPEVWVASLDDRALRERLLRRMHLVRLRTSAKNRIFGLLSQWGLRVSVKRLRQADGLLLLERLPLPEVWRASIAEALAVIELLDERIAPIEAELAPLAEADGRVRLLRTIPGIGSLLALTVAVEIGEIARFPSWSATRAGCHACTSRARARAPDGCRRRARRFCAGRPPSSAGGLSEPLAPTVRRRPPPTGKRPDQRGNCDATGFANRALRARAGRGCAVDPRPCARRGRRRRRRWSGCGHVRRRRPGASSGRVGDPGLDKRALGSISESPTQSCPVPRVQGTARCFSVRAYDAVACSLATSGARTRFTGPAHNRGPGARDASPVVGKSG